MKPNTTKERLMVRCVGCSLEEDCDYTPDSLREIARRMEGAGIHHICLNVKSGYYDSHHLEVEHWRLENDEEYADRMEKVEKERVRMEQVEKDHEADLAKRRADPDYAKFLQLQKKFR